MKKNSLKDYYLYLTAKSISSLVRFIPINFSIFMGRSAGALAFYFLENKRNTAYRNLKIAFPQYSCREINRILKQTFQNCAQHFVELFYLPWMGQDYIKRHIEFQGLDAVLNIIENKKGAIFLGLHEGSWEVASAVLAQALVKYNYTILARGQGDIPLLNELLNKYRTKRHCNIIAITDNFRPIVGHLRNGFALGMVADHGAHGGIFVDFFGKPALTPTGALKLALKFDTNLVIGFIKSSGAAKHKIILTSYNLVRTTDENQDLKINLENVNRKFEEHIRNSPAEYLWFFKRWKHSPQRNILVLSDGKAGHLKQSLVVLDLIKNLPLQIKSNVIEIKFKNNWQKIAFHVCALFFSNGFQGCMKCLQVLSDCADFEKFMSNYYDAVISCGSGLAVLNRLIAFENRAKSIIIMKPGMFSLRRFDLAIIPEHDNVRKLNNIVFIKGALSSRAGKNKEQIEKIIKDYSLDNPKMARPVIGVLLGGNNKCLSLDANRAEGMINSLDDFIQRRGGSVLVSTSRRTTKDIEELLKKKLAKRPGYRMLVIANEFNPLGSIEAILHLSDILVVSGDSISMVSEAVNSGKYTVVFKLKRKFPYLRTKHERFIERLRQDGHIYVCNNNLSNSLMHIWKYNPLKKKINDGEIILDRLKRIL